MSSLREKYLGTSNTTSTNTSLRQKYGLEKNSKYYKNIYEDELKKQKDIRKDIDTNFANQGVQTNTGYFTTQRNILSVQQQSEITKNKKFEVYDNALQKNKEIEQKFQNIKNSDEYQKQEKNLIEQSNKVAYSKYDYDKSLVDEDDIGWYDKSIGTIVQGGKSIFDISGGLVKNENGDNYFLPNKTELKQQKVQESYDTKIGKLLGNAGYEIGRIGATTAINQVLPGIGSSMYFGRIFMDSTNSAISDGYDSGSAIAYGAVNTAVEYLVGKVLGSATKGLTGGKTSGYEELLNKTFNKIINKPQISKILANAGSEATEEFVQEYLDNLTKLAILDKSTNIKDYASVFADEEVFSAAVYSALVGAITGGTLGTISGQNTNVKNSDVYNTLKTELEQVKQNTTNKETISRIDNMIGSINSIQNNDTSVKNDIVIKENINMPTVNNIVAQEQNSSNTLPSVKTNFNTVNLPTVNDLIKNSINTSSNSNQSLPTRNLTFEESASRYNIDINNDTIKSISKLMSNRGINAKFDNNLFNDTNTNAVWIPIINKSGQIVGREVVFNPNADTNQLLQDVAVHEIYHDIVYNDKGNVLNDLIQSFNLNIDGFEKARQELSEMYAKKYPNLDQNSTEFQNIVNEEVVASILGKKLGSQEYINRLVHEKPSVAKRIYDFVIDKLNQLNKLVGYKNEKLFWEDVKNKFEKAYREEYKQTNKKTDAKYSIVGVNGVKNLKNGSLKNLLIDSYNYAVNLSNQNASNEEIYKQTYWYQDDKGNWKIEIPDNKMTINYKRNIKPGVEYKLDDIIEHDLLFSLYPELKNYTINFKNYDSKSIVMRLLGKSKNMKKGGNFNSVTKAISVNKNWLSKKNYDAAIRKTLIHEIQHAIQNIEGFETGASSKISRQHYLSSKGEAEARVTSERLDYSDRSRKRKLEPFFESQKNNLDKKYNSYMNNRGVIDKIKDNLYNYFEKVLSNENSEEVDIQFEDENLRLANDRGTQRYVNEELDNSSFSNDVWQEYLNKNYKSEGTGQTLQDIKLPTRKDVSKINMPLVENKKIMNPNEISKMTKEDANTTPILPTIKVSTGTGESKFASNIEYKTDMLTETSKDTILSDSDVNYYQEVTNQESLKKAYERLNKNGKNEVMNWLSKDSAKADSTDVAEGWILLKQYQDSVTKETDLIKKDELNRSMVQVAKKMREIGTKAGQTVQAFNILNRLTPEGMVYYAQTELSEAFQVMSKNKTKEWIDNNRDKFELTPEETQFIMDTMKEVQQMEDGYDKRVKLAEIQKVMTDKLPPSKGAGIKAWMRISMLFNPKTQVRNVMGNAVIAPVNTFSDLFASIVDSQIAKKTGVRTTGKTNLKNYAKGFKKGAFESYNDFKKGINTRNIQGNRFEITEGKSFNDNTSIGKALNRVDSLLSFMLDAGDRTFYEATFTNSINNQLILNNTNVVTQEMIDIATSEALSRTWQDNNNYTKGVLWVRNWLNNVNVKGYGLGDVLIPFAKTPANLTKAIIDYSPAGLVNTIIEGNNLRKALTNEQYTAQMQHQFVQDLGKATAGTMLYVLGYALAKAGVISGESDDDKDVSNFMKNTLGVNSYSIKIGDKSFTYDWAQPIAAPLSIMANYVNKTKQNPNASKLENLVSSLDVAGNIILEQSFMESINTVLSNNEGIATGIQEAILDLPSRAIPTLMKQIADLIDPVQRTSFEYDKPLQSSINSIKAKIPFVSKTLAPSVDTMGREIKKYGGKNNIFNVFLNPANVNTENISKSAEEIYRLYKSTGETNIMPRVAPYYVNQDGEKITLNSKQRAEYQKISGEIIENNVEKLLETSEYNNMSDKEKAEVIKNIVNYSYNMAQKEILDIELSNTYQKAYEYSQIGDISDFYTFKASIDDTDKDTKKESITKYLINCNLKDNQVALLYGSYYSSEKVLDSLLNANIPIKEFIKFNSQEFTTDYYDNGKAVTNSRKNKVINYINSLNLTIPQKAMLIKLEYSSYTGYDSQIVNYINNMKYSKFEKASLLKLFGFDNYDKYLIDYVNNMNKTKEEKTEILEEMGFTIRNGKVYS